MTEKKISSEASARAACALAEIDPEAGTGIAKLISLVANGDKRAIEIIGMYERKEITAEQALELVGEYLGQSN